MSDAPGQRVPDLKFRYYILDGKTPVGTDDLMAWSLFFENSAHRTVAVTQFPGGYVSTVFLGLDHNWGPGPPLLFETMIFGGPHDEYQDRYATWDEADAGHAKAVAFATDLAAGQE